MNGNADFAVSIVDRERMRYQEPGRSLIVSAEALLGDRPFAVYWNYMVTEVPGVDEYLNEDERLKIVDNIQAWFRLRGYEVDFFPPLDPAMRWSSL